jgi:hypothetical protein
VIKTERERTNPMNFSPLAFAELVLEIAADRIGQEQVLAWLEPVIAKVESDYQAVKELCASCDYDQESPTEIALGLGALEDFREALALVEDYFSEGDAEYLEEAAGLAASAQQKLDGAYSENQKASESFRCDLTF